MLAKTGSEGLALARAAGCYAWILLRENPDFAPVGSAYRQMRQLPVRAQQAWISTVAAYHVHSAGIEGIHVDYKKAKAELKNLFLPRSKRRRKNSAQTQRARGGHGRS